MTSSLSYQPVLHAFHRRAGDCALGHLHHARHVYADRERRRRELTAAGAEAVITEAGLEEADPCQPLDKAAHVAAGLESDDVITRQHIEDQAVSGQGTQHIDIRERDMQEQADGILDAGLAQLAGQRDQVIVVGPDDVVSLQHRAQLAREQRIDPLIGVTEAPLVVEEVEHVMAQRPQTAVGIAVVIILEFGLIDIDRGVAHLAASDHGRIRGFAAAGLAAPSEPHAALFAQSGEQPYRQAASGLASAGIGDAVRYGDQAAQNAVSQGSLRRSAALMIPTML